MDLHPHTLPSDLIFDCQETFAPFLIFVSDPSMPTIDVDAVLGAICDALKRERDANQNLLAVAKHMAYEDGMVESLHDDAYYPYEFAPQVYDILLALGNRLLDLLRACGAYLSGYFPYSYGTTLHGHSAIHFTLDTRGPAQASPFLYVSRT